MKRPIPVADALSAPFWAAVRSHRLEIQRCMECGRYFHPPVTFCLDCRSLALKFMPVSGRGRVYEYTEVRSGARQEYFEKKAPYLMGVVELVEQDGLFMYTNFPGASLEDLKVGEPVEIVFEELDAGIVLPQFKLSDIAGDLQ